MVATGIVKFYNAEKGFGFIIPIDPEGNPTKEPDVFFHISNGEENEVAKFVNKNGRLQLPDPVVQDRVTYTAIPGRKGQEAKPWSYLERVGAEATVSEGSKPRPASGEGGSASRGHSSTRRNPDRRGRTHPRPPRQHAGAAPASRPRLTAPSQGASAAPVVRPASPPPPDPEPEVPTGPVICACGKPGCKGCGHTCVDCSKVGINCDCPPIEAG